MQFSTLLIAVVAAGASLGLAAPAQENSAAAQSCSNGWDVCGVCQASASSGNLTF